MCFNFQPSSDEHKFDARNHQQLFSSVHINALSDDENLIWYSQPILLESWVILIWSWNSVQHKAKQMPALTLGLHIYSVGFAYIKSRPNFAHQGWYLLVMRVQNVYVIWIWFFICSNISTKSISKRPWLSHQWKYTQEKYTILVGEERSSKTRMTIIYI